MKIHKFDILFDKIPKDPEVWTEEDVLIWLKIIGMDQYAEHFGEMKIDGLIILELNDQELLEELKIKAPLHRKKILKAIEVLKEYHEYFRDSNEASDKGKSGKEGAKNKNQGNTNRWCNADQLTKGADEHSRPLANQKERMNEEHGLSCPQTNNNIRNQPGIIRLEETSHSDGEIPHLINSEGNSNGMEGPINNRVFANNEVAPLHAQGQRNQFIPGASNQHLNVTTSPFPGLDQQKDGRAQNFNYPYVKPVNPPSYGQDLTSKSADDKANLQIQFHGHQGFPAPVSNEKIFIVINSIEGPSDLNHTISEQGARIGRHSSNQIVIYDESVSRHHAEIFLNPSVRQFYLRDIGSTTGTFIKIVDAIELKLDLIIEIGSYQLMVSNIFISNSSNAEENMNNSFVELTIYESPEETPERVFTLASGSSIGRKANNVLSFADDLHMSNLHCKVNLVGQKFMFEDMASTNGSWLRLSKEGVESRPMPLTNETVFKIGNSAMYEVSVPKAVKANNDSNTINHNTDKNGGNQSTACTICWDAERDCLIMPCKHNISCTRCIKSVKNCPICRAAITDIIKIYKS